MAGRKRTPDMQTLPVRMEIVGVEKRKGISKYYVYVIQVTCRDGSHYTINRRYRQFDELQRLLDQRFPVEAGELNPKERILPTLPGKLYLSRSAVREVTDKRLPLLNSYLQQLFSLPNNIRYDSIVKNFSRQTPQERENNRHDNKGPTGHPSKPIRPALPIPSPAAQNKPPRPAPPTRSAPPPRPAPPTKPPPPTIIRGPRAKALAQYSGQYSDELSFPAGAIIALLKEVDSNWVQGQLGGREGLVPVSYLSILEPLARQESEEDMEQSDEWESEEEEDTSYITCYVGGVASHVRVAADLVQKPSLQRLRNAIQDHLGQRNFVLNYQDSDGDLIEIVDQGDLDLMHHERASHRQQAPWTFHLTDPGDHTPYHTHPYR